MMEMTGLERPLAEGKESIEETLENNMASPLTIFSERGKEVGFRPVKDRQSRSSTSE
jgi:hypothetical protein